MKRTPTACLILVLLGWLAGTAALAAPVKRVLLLSALSETEPWGLGLVQGMSERLRNAPMATELYVEKTGNDHNRRRADDLDPLIPYLQARYADRAPDIIVTADDSATQFLVKYRQHIFPQAAVIYVSAMPLPAEQAAQLGPTRLAVLDPPEYEATIRLIGQVLPKVQRVAFIGAIPSAPGAVLFQRQIELARSLYPEVLDLSAVAFEDLLPQLAKLPPDSAVFVTPWVKRRSGITLSPTDMLDAVVPATKAPAFSLFDFYLDHGILGGVMLSGSGRGKVLGDLASALVGRAPGDPMPVPVASAHPTLFSHAALARFGVAPRLLPSGSIVVGAPKSMAETNPALYYGGGATLAVLIVVIVFLLRDIGRRHRIATLLEENELRLTQIVSGLPFATLVVDGEHRVTHWNKRTEAVTGISVEDIRHSRDAMARYFGAQRSFLADYLVDGLSREQIAARYSPDARLTFQGPPEQPVSVDVVARWVTPNGEQGWINSRGQILRDQAGKITGVVQTVIDITESTRAREVLESMNEQLEARVSERTQELAQAHEDLQKAMHELVQREKLGALGKIVAGVAHELNTPLGNSLAVVTTLQQQVDDFSGKVANEQLRRADLADFIETTTQAASMLERNTRRAAELVLSFKNLAVDQGSNRRRQFDLAELLREVVNVLSPSLRRVPVRIDVNVPAGLQFDSFPGPMEQVLTNLINNAVVHALGDRARLVISISANRLADAATPSVCLSLTDDGAGMSEATVKRIFDPFFTTRLGKGGSGLGLYLVFNLVNDVLGGKIAVDSAPGAGSRFMITLPLLAPASPEPHN